MFRHRTVWLWRLLATAATVAVCPAQFFSPPAEGSFAKVEVLAGQVSVLKDSFPWALRTGDSVRPGQQVITGADGYAVLRVSDGSIFEVFANSRASFRANSGSWSDLIDLWIGRIRVHIEKVGGQPNPNRIHTPTAVISVRGTIFDVSVDEDDSTLVAVEEGQVAVRHRLIAHEEPKILNSGEHVRVYKDAPLAKGKLDKSGVIERAAHALADAMWTIVLRNSGPTGLPRPPVGGPGPTLPGDTASPLPPPPPPPGLPPPPGGGN